MGYICDARREAGVELWRDSEPDAGCVPDGLPVTLGRGDAGTEFRSGAMVPVRVYASRWRGGPSDGQSPAWSLLYPAMSGHSS
jgi:hypothetical protein